MKEDFKLCLKLIKYSYNYKDETITSIIMFFIGILLFAAESLGDTLAIGPSLMVVCAPIMFIKGLDSLSASYMVCSSPKRRFLELTFRNIWTVGATIVGYAIWVLLIGGLLLAMAPGREPEIARWIIWSCLLHSVMILFTGIYTKYYWQGVLILFSVGMAFIFCSIFWDDAFASFTKFGPAAVTGFVITMVSALLACVLRAYAYKKPVVRGRIGKKMLREM